MKAKEKRMMGEQCSWCNLSPEERKYLVFENSCWSVYLADKQDYIGRCVIVSKRHCGSLTELNDGEWNSLREVIIKLEKCFKNVLGAELVNWSCLLNDFYKEENPNPHLHLHVRPRYRNKLNFCGQIYADEEFGHHYNPKKEIKISETIMNKLFEKIRTELSDLQGK